MRRDEMLRKDNMSARAYKKAVKKGPSGYLRENMDRGNVDFKSRISEGLGDIMSIATRDVVTVPPSTTIMGVVKTMMSYRFRRVPIADAGSRRLEGIVTSVDIIDFVGGGKKHCLVQNRYNGNLLAAINESIREIMEEDVITIGETGSLKDAVKTMVEHNTGGLPITDKEGVITGIVTERDFVWLVAGLETEKTVSDYTQDHLVTIQPDTSIEQATRAMIKNQIRRLPITKDGILIGIITASDVVRYVGSGEVFQKLVVGDIQEAFGLPAKTLIKKDITWVKPTVDIGEAAQIMVDNNVGSLPVIEDGELVGILTERDYLRALAEE